jgi:hypothetical protein
LKSKANTAKPSTIKREEAKKWLIQAPKSFKESP